MTKASAGLRQEQVLRQSQTLTPQQLTFFRLLEMNDTRLEEEVKSRVEENPALGIDPEDNDTPRISPPADNPSKDTSPYYRDAIPASEMAWNAVVSAEPSLHEHLKAQYALSPLSEERPELDDIAAFVIDSIDADGYLRLSADDLADDLAVTAGRYVAATDVDTVIAAVRDLDPAGVAAPDLRECLLLQARRMPEGPLRRNVADVLSRGFDALARHSYDELASRLGLGRDALAEAVDAIQRLNPRPGAGFATGTALSGDADEGISPDFEIEPGPGGRVSLSMPSRLPSLVVEKSFDIDKLPSRESRSSESDTWIRRRRDDARSFIEALGQRRKTLTDIMTAIIARQKAWFTGPDAGSPRALRPMVLKDIAADTGYDISTVSRAVQGKYAATPWGLMALKAFFNEGLGGEGDAEAAVSQAAVADELRTLIEAEDPRRPLSDSQLADALQSRGIDIARRTVAKYRYRLGIAPARERRKI